MVNVPKEKNSLHFTHASWGCKWTIALMEMNLAISF